jgi:hypothetical protein
VTHDGYLSLYELAFFSSPVIAAKLAHSIKTAGTVLYQQPPNVINFIKDYVNDTKRQLSDDDYASFRQRVASIHARTNRRNSFLATPIAILPGMIGNPKITFARLSIPVQSIQTSSSTLRSHSFRIATPTHFQCSQLSLLPSTTANSNLPHVTAQHPTNSINPTNPITHKLIDLPIAHTDVQQPFSPHIVLPTNRSAMSESRHIDNIDSHGVPTHIDICKDNISDKTTTSTVYGGRHIDSTDVDRIITNPHNLSKATIM